MKRKVSKAKPPKKEKMKKEMPKKKAAPKAKAKSSGKKNWIQGAIKHPGALRKSLHIKEGKDIPEATLDKAAKKGGTMGRRARLAITLKKLRKNK